MLLAGEVDPRVVLVEADGNVGVGLVVAQTDVEAGPVALDEALLSEQRLGLRRGDEELDAIDAAGETALAAGEVGGDALADRASLADVEDLAVATVEEVDAGRVGNGAALLRDPLGAREAAAVVVFGHLRQRVRMKVKSKLRYVPPFARVSVGAGERRAKAQALGPMPAALLAA